MHNNYFFLRQLSKALNQELSGFTLVSCFSQNKDELIIEFNNGDRSIFIKASLTSDFCCLSFPKVFHRARKNSMDLFLPVLMKKVGSVRVFENERSFIIHLDDNFGLLFKMHGNRANLLLTQGEKVIEIFRNHLQTDLDLVPATLHRTIDWSEAYFMEHRHELAKTYFTFGKHVLLYLEENGFHEKSADQQWELFQRCLQLLQSPTYFLAEVKGQLVLTLLSIGNMVRAHQHPVEALNDYYSTTVQQGAILQEKSRIQQHLTVRIKNAQSFLKKNEPKLTELEHDQHWQQWADLIMANLHRLEQGAGSITVENFYDENRLIEIPLKQELSGQRNAEVFYRKGKNQHIEVSKLRESIVAKREELKRLEEKLTEVERASSLAELQEKSIGINKAQQELPSRPYHEFLFQGYRIWVGKDAQSNDELTLKHSYKEDLWLHAKDVPGSHVLIKHQAGKNFPKDVIERAAELAAYNSKRKNESLCPVSVTPKKFVRKRKGDPAGAVVVEREDVVMVVPKL